MELLTILYAMLAALTGISVGESAPARSADMGCSAAALITEVVAAEQQQRTIAARPLPPVAVARTVGQDCPLVAMPQLTPRALVAWIDLGRRHL